MKVSTFIALRYVRPQRLTFMSIIGLLSMVGIAIGTAALIVVMSMFNGFRSVADNLMIGFGPHLRITAVNGGMIVDTQRVLSVVRSVGLATPIATSRVVLQRAGITGVATAIGVSHTARMDGVRKSIVVGQYNTQPDDASGLPGIVIGVGLAEQLQVFLGDTVTLLSPAMIEVAMTSMARPTGRAAVIRGMFQSNAMRDIDYGTVITSDVLVQNLSRRKGIDAIDVLVEHPRDVAAIAASLRSNVGATLQVDTWQDLNRGLYDTMKLERLGSFIVLALIVVVAAFNILVTLTLGVSEKRRDIAVLKTMGATDSVVARVFRVQGLVIGLMSVMLGTLCGLGLVLGQQTFQWVRFDSAAGYLVPALPVELHVADVLATAATGMLLSSIAAIYPARRAARAVVADGVRAD